MNKTIRDIRLIAMLLLVSIAALTVPVSTVAQLPDLMSIVQRPQGEIASLPHAEDRGDVLGP